MKRVALFAALLAVATAGSSGAMDARVRINDTSGVRAVKAAQLALVTINKAIVPLPALTAANTLETSDAQLNRDRGRLLMVLPFVFLIGTVKTVAADNDSAVARDSIRAQLNKLVDDFYYFLLNNVASSTIATQPACARATTASKVKTTNATVMLNGGVAKALAASDNFWTLTGGNIAAGFFRRYLLLVDAAGVATVLASSDAATAAACVFPNLPAAGIAIVGILTIQNATNPFVPGTTLLSAAGVTDTYIDGIDDSVIQSAKVLKQ